MQSGAVFAGLAIPWRGFFKALFQALADFVADGAGVLLVGFDVFEFVPVDFVVGTGARGEFAADVEDDRAEAVAEFDVEAGTFGSAVLCLQGLPLDLEACGGGAACQAQRFDVAAAVIFGEAA